MPVCATWLASVFGLCFSARPQADALLREQGVKEERDGRDASDVDGAGEAGEDALEELPGEVEQVGGRGAAAYLARARRWRRRRRGGASGGAAGWTSRRKETVAACPYPLGLLVPRTALLGCSEAAEAARRSLVPRAAERSPGPGVPGPQPHRTVRVPATAPRASAPRGGVIAEL